MSVCQHKIALNFFFLTDTPVGHQLSFCCSVTSRTCERKRLKEELNLLMFEIFLKLDGA